MTAGRGRRVRLAGRVVAVALGLGLGLGLAECAARVLLDPPRTHEAPLELHPVLGFRGIPGVRIPLEDDRGSFDFVLGREGLRGREIPPAPADARRVVFLGDSFLMGLGLREEDLVTARTERGLRQPGSAVEVYNLSAIDWGTGQQLLLFEQLRQRLAPHDVVLVLYPANDVANDTPGLAGRTRVSPGDAIRPYVVPEGDRLRVSHVHPVRGALRSRSRLFALVERALFPLELEGGVASGSLAERLRSGRLPLEELEVFRRHDPGNPWEEGWRRSFALLSFLRDGCRVLGARLVVLVVPSEHQVQRAAKAVAWDVASRFVSGAPLAARLDWNLPERRLAAFFEEAGIDGRLLLGPLREAVSDGRRVYLRDGHLSPEGHAVAARLALAALSDPPSPARSTPVQGRPLPLLPVAAAARAELDFGRARHEPHLGDGWFGWRPDGDPGGGGWQVADRALFVLPARPGRLVIEGVVPETARLPILLRIERVGDPAQTLRLDGPGAFRIEAGFGAARASARSDGYAAFVLDPAPERGPLASPLRVRRIALAPAPGGAR
jgi:hypothetical protein